MFLAVSPPEISIKKGLTGWEKRLKKDSMLFYSEAKTSISIQRKTVD
jgi:hypothetical protein